MDIILTKMIEVILADREFVGEEWLAYLSKHQILPFAIRVRKNEKIKHFNGDQIKWSQYFAHLKTGEQYYSSHNWFATGKKTAIGCE